MVALAASSAMDRRVHGINKNEAKELVPSFSRRSRIILTP